VCWGGNWGKWGGRGERESASVHIPFYGGGAIRYRSIIFRGAVGDVACRVVRWMKFHQSDVRGLLLSSQNPEAQHHAVIVRIVKKRYLENRTMCYSFSGRYT
jgi:hypothetical protein